MVVRKVIPRRAVFAVVLPYRPPLPLAQIGAPFLPRNDTPSRIVQTFPLFISHPHLLLMVNSEKARGLKFPIKRSYNQWFKSPPLKIHCLSTVPRDRIT